jgi:hypothetical protein
MRTRKRKNEFFLCFVFFSCVLMKNFIIFLQSKQQKNKQAIKLFYFFALLSVLPLLFLAELGESATISAGTLTLGGKTDITSFVDDRLTLFSVSLPVSKLHSASGTTSVSRTYYFERGKKSFLKKQN